MIYIITLSPAIDNYINLENLEIGQTNRSTSQTVVLGGKGINESKLLKNLGFNSYQLISTISNKHEEFILDELKGINHRLFEAKDTRINTKINFNNEITEINASSIPLSLEEFTLVENYLIDNINKEDYLVVAGNIDSINHKKMTELLIKLRHKTQNIILDSSNINLEELELIKPLLIKPNMEELNTIFSPNQSDISLGEKLSKLNSLGVKNILLSVGAKGAILSSESSTLQALVEKQEVINTVGAGDSMVAGFLYKHSNGFNNYECLKFATMCGSATAYSQDIGDLNMIESVKVTIKEINEI